MSSRTPIVRQISWSAMIPQIVAFAVMVVVGFFLNGDAGASWGAIAFISYSICTRQLIARDHRAGIWLVRQNRFTEAIPKFQQSFDFFERHDWIDRFRPVILMSPSAVSYREMALANIAFCYGQVGNGTQCRMYYERCLERFPNSGLATTALRMLDAAVSTSLS